MRRALLIVVLLALACRAWAQTFKGCACGKNPPGRPAARSMKPYAQEPEDMQPFSKFTEPYYPALRGPGGVQRCGARHSGGNRT